MQWPWTSQSAGQLSCQPEGLGEQREENPCDQDHDDQDPYDQDRKHGDQDHGNQNQMHGDQDQNQRHDGQVHEDQSQKQDDQVGPLPLSPLVSLAWHVRAGHCSRRGT